MVKSLDERTDIWSLGIVLFELLTAHRPFEDANDDEYREFVLALAVEPKLPDNVPRDVRTICLKCLRKHRSDRYQTAGRLAEDLRRFLSGRPVSARPVRFIERSWMCCRRNWAVTASLATVAITLLVGICLSTYFAINADIREKVAVQEKRRADTSEKKAVRERDVARRIAYISSMQLARREWDNRHVAFALDLLDAQRPRPGETDLRHFEWHYLERLCHSELLTLHGHQEFISRFAIADGKLLALGWALIRP